MEGMSWRRISCWNGPYVYKPWLRLVCKDVYDMERFEEIRQIAAEMLIELSGQPLEVVKELFCNETGYQTPKLDTRAAIFQEDKILLVQENDGLWSLPGG